MKTNIEKHQKTVLLVGSGNLFERARRQCGERGYLVTSLPTARFTKPDDPELDETLLENRTATLREAGARTAHVICILDTEDRVTLSILLAALAASPDRPIIVALHDEDLARHIDAAHARVTVVNPGALSAPAFLAALEVPERSPRRLPRLLRIPEFELLARRRDWLSHQLIAGFCILYAMGMGFFRITEKISWSECFEYMATAVTTVNFNDVIARNLVWWARIGRGTIMLGIWAFVFFALAFVVNGMVRHYTETTLLGRRRYTLRGHVVVVGLGHVGALVVEALRHSGRDVIVIEKDASNRYIDAARSLGAHVLVGDASLPRTLRDAALTDAAALIAVADEDYRNLEIGLVGRGLRPELRVILRIHDRGAAEEVRTKFGIQFTVSTSVIAADYLMRAVDQVCRPS